MSDDNHSIKNFYGCPGKSVARPKKFGKFLGLIFVALTDFKAGVDPVLRRIDLHGKSNSSRRF